MIAYNFARSPPSFSGHAGANFTSTRWSVILAARDYTGPGGEAAMASLCATYWLPLYAYVRRQGRSVEDAQDLTQSFSPTSWKRALCGMSIRRWAGFARSCLRRSGIFWPETGAIRTLRSGAAWRQL
jgi:RNA polymerase sigma-70 factor (ECF subfamily)